MRIVQYSLKQLIASLLQQLIEVWHVRARLLQSANIAGRIVWGGGNVSDIHISVASSSRYR